MDHDIIGDIHGYADKLEALLKELGYRQTGGAWRHPSRQAIFVGDYIDRGPQQLKTLNLVRAMVDAGSARAIMGNHEFNAIAWATKDPLNDGQYLRARDGEKGHHNWEQHKGFLAELNGDDELHQEWVDWFKGLPLWIEEEGFRVVHACWSPNHVDDLQSHLLDGVRLTSKVIEDGNRKGTGRYNAIEAVLKGPEIKLPEGHSFGDSSGKARKEIRIRWWSPELTTYRAAYIGPKGADIPDLPIIDHKPLPEPDRPTFIGHYWFDHRVPMAPASRRVVCVDYSVSEGGPLAGYRFDGDPNLSADQFVSAG